jgi:hypothetical protein
MAAEETPDSPRPPSSRGGPTSRQQRVGIIVVAAIVIGIVIWLIVRGGGDDNKQATTTQPTAPPAGLDLAGLRNFAKGLGHPMYWAGPRTNRTYEVTQTQDGSVYLRYLPPGVAPGASQPLYLSVGTYPNTTAYQTAQQAAARKGATVLHLKNKGLGVTSPRTNKSVYLAYPNSQVLVEVFTPDPARSLRLVRSGAIVPIT